MGLWLVHCAMCLGVVSYVWSHRSIENILVDGGPAVKAHLHSRGGFPTGYDAARYFTVGMLRVH